MSKKQIVESLATGLYVGKIPWMPGTFGSLWGIPVALLFSFLGPLGYMFAALSLLFFAVVVCEMYERSSAEHDSREIVIDEVVGYVIAMTWLPFTWQSFVAAFVVFRFFDILKPFPISQIDKKVSGGFGTVLDDVAAGIFTNVALQIVYVKTPLLGTQLGV